MGSPSGGTFDVPSSSPAAAEEVASSLLDPFGVRSRLVAGLRGGSARPGHLVTNVWAFSPSLEELLLVEHPRFGWMPPGGHVDPGELPSASALRELFEETGLAASLALPAPLSVWGGAGPSPDHVHYCLAFACVLDPALPLTPEPGQAAAWFRLDSSLPESRFRDNVSAFEYRDLLTS